jgi:tetratricopeptide (TPR) repeat protein
MWAVGSRRAFKVTAAAGEVLGVVRMEIRLSLGLLALLLVAAAALSASRPRAVLEPTDSDVVALAELEDAAGLSRDDIHVTRRLATTYLRLGQPWLAIAAVRSAPPELARDPLLTHRLSQAYEASGRVDDALSTAQLARARCRSAAGAVPVCSAATQAALEMHEEALGMLVRWGVQEPRRDTRTGLAYRLAQRTARIASLGLNAPAE